MNKEQNLSKEEYARILEAQYNELLAKSPRSVVEEMKAIERGEKLPSLTEDIPFKKAFDADSKKERLTTLLRLIFKFHYEVVSSLKNEPVKATIYSKKTILDVLAKLSNNAVTDVEMQVVAQEFITKRIDVYSSDMIMMQYSVHEGEKKKEFSFEDIEKTYVAVLMKQSPKLFKDNKSYIHRKVAMTDTGITLPALDEIVYIELDKCLEQFRGNMIPEEDMELATWLAMIADINDEYVQEKASSLSEYRKLKKELSDMGKDKEEMVSMLAEKYEEIIRNSEIKEARDEGRNEGRMDVLKRMLGNGLSESVIKDCGYTQEEINRVIEQQN